MSKSAVFPYGITLRKDGVFDTFPVAEVSFLTVEGEWLTLFLLVDSGATISALPQSDAAFFGISLKKGRRTSVAGISGKALVGWQHNVLVLLKEEKIKIPIVFLEGKYTPRILGRAGIFSRHLIIFEENKKQTAFLDYNTNTAKSVSATIEKIKHNKAR